MKNDFKIKKKALSDIENIADFIAKDNKQAAIKMIKLFYKIKNNYIQIIRVLTAYQDICTQIL